MTNPNEIKSLNCTFNQQIQKELEEQEERLDILHECGDKLIQESGDDIEAKDEIEKQLKDFDGCWNDIATQVIQGKEKVKHKKQKPIKIVSY